MARKARTLASTRAKFIAPDDSAIGCELAVFQERYTQYIHTADHRLLDLKPNEKPAFYYLRPFQSQEQARIREYFASIRTLQADAPPDMTQEALVKAVREGDPDASRFDALKKEIVYECIIGCDDHPMVEDEVTDSGKLRETRVLWVPGTPEPASVRDSIAKDPMLVNCMFQYLFTVSSLSETEKN